ncbi:Rieske 2Fe-2S domain-containing protein [Shewanella insulae]|uniref:aromatic ring-hydroxylating oxygenase subunit alpha n=1 Tax=Shewanella insulae TaxID=2681496 RepID=UPI001EFDC83D|nr:SRPBCC family protein [Shewanella insulae]MCG9737610.1 Rieske 2Fe-2S domain-containing protein [Shewanella insulae]
MIAKQSLHPEHYYDARTLEVEQTQVFEKSWVFVGFKDQISQNHDFITLQVGNTPVVVQNFNGELSALLNVCSHRKAKLQTAQRGNRPLLCPYHCWSYKSDGALSGVPQNRTDFGLDDLAKKKLALKQFSLASCGNMLFVRVAKEGPGLEEFLGPYFNILEEISNDFVDPVQQGNYHWETNWKLACETVLEVYHVAGTHPETFAKFAKPEVEVAHFNGHTTGNTPLQDAPKKWWAGARKHLKLEQSASYSEYNHFFIYPNLAIGLTNGSLMSLQTYEPKGTTQSQLNFQLRMMRRLDGGATSDAVKAAIKANFTEFNHTILEEDRLVAESCQANMQSVDSAGILGKCEERILHFHDAWRHDVHPHLSLRD